MPEKIESTPRPLTLNVTVPRAIFYDLEKMQALTKSIMTRCGHPICCSGIVLNYKEELDFVVQQQGTGQPEIFGAVSHAAL
jgi:hypothetical protein